MFLGQKHRLEINLCLPGVSSGICTNVRILGFPAEHCSVPRSAILFTLTISSFNVEAVSGSLIFFFPPTGDPIMHSGH